MRTFVPLTAEIVAELYPEKKPRETLQGYAYVEHTDEGVRPLVMFALVRHGTHRLLICAASREIRREARLKRTFTFGRAQLSGIAAVRKMIQGSSLPVFARADPAIEGADRLLVHIGFEPFGDEPNLFRYRT